MTNPNSTRILKMPTYGWRLRPTGRNSSYAVTRNRLEASLDDAATDKTKLAATLRKAAEWLTKRQG